MTTLIALILAFAGALQTSPQPAPPVTSLPSLVDSVDRAFASMKDFSADFFQNSTNSVNQRQQDKGHLYLTKDRKMRWDYLEPEVKQWISNGKTLYTYIPANHQVIQEQVKNSMAEQIPIMFLIGRSGLRNEFQKIEEQSTKPLFEGDRVLRLTPNRKGQGIEKIDIEVNPRTNLIDRMVILSSDKSSNELIFMNIEINTNIPASKFEFTIPPGTRVVQGSAIQ
jgi:outer membrane lipoprotein carrier protein